MENKWFNQTRGSYFLRLNVDISGKTMLRLQHHVATFNLYIFLNISKGKLKKRTYPVRLGWLTVSTNVKLTLP